MRVCSVAGCPEFYPRAEGTRCTKHRVAADKARGSSRDRGYNTRGHQIFRAAVLAADPICVMCGKAQATVADHYPRSRKELIALGLNANDPRYGRGLDKRCHDQSTAVEQPGGFNARPNS